jgi:hypothetical protein
LALISQVETSIFSFPHTSEFWLLRLWTPGLTPAAPPFPQMSDLWSHTEFIASPASLVLQLPDGILWDFSVSIITKASVHKKYILPSLHIYVYVSCADTYVHMHMYLYMHVYITAKMVTLLNEISVEDTTHNMTLPIRIQHG